MRIAHVVRQYHPSVGGMEEVVRNLARHQLAAGHAPEVITLDRLFRDRRHARERRLPLPESDTLEGVPIRRLAYRGSSRYPLCPQVLAWVREADLIHVHGVDFFFDFLAATRRLHRRALLASTHGGFFHTRYAAALKRVYFRTVTRGAAQAYDRIVATSAGDGTLFAPIVAAARLAVIENGVDVRKFSDCAAWPLTPTLIYFGRWAQNKGLPETLALLAALRRRDPSWRLILAGREYDYDAAQLGALAAGQGLAGAVELHPNPDDAALAGLIGRASWFVCLSRHEGFGLAAIEAMSAGLLPVLSDIPPFRAVVEGAGLGLLVDAGEAEAAAQWLQALHGAAAEDYGAWRAHAMACAAGYDWEQVAGRYLRVYEQLEQEA